MRETVHDKENQLTMQCSHTLHVPIKNGIEMPLNWYRHRIIDSQTILHDLQNQRGFHTPKHLRLKQAVHDKVQINIWYGHELEFSTRLKSLMPKSSLPIYQIMADGETILPFELMREDHTEKASVISCILRALGILYSVIVCFSLVGIRARLQLNSDIKKDLV